jgi:hypothetical protein
LIGECIHHIPVINIREPDADTCSQHDINLYCAHCNVFKSVTVLRKCHPDTCNMLAMIQECSHNNL